MIILTNKPGRLANRLFLFANFVANAKDRGRTVVASSFDEYAVYFERFAGTFIPRYPQRRRPTASPAVRILRHILFRLLNRVGKALDQLKLHHSPLHACLVATHTNIFDLSDSSLQASLDKPLVFVRNYFFHDLPSLRRHRDFIVSYFAPGAAYRERAKLFVARERGDSDVLIGSHVRRGDYRRWRSGRYFYSDREYESLVHRVAALFSSTTITFLVCSDEEITLSPEAGLTWSNGPGTEIDDLLAFSLCDYLVGPPSSFTRWAAFVGNIPLLVVEDPGQEITLADFKDALDSPWASHQTVSPTGKYAPRNSESDDGEPRR